MGKNLLWLLDWGARLDFIGKIVSGVIALVVGGAALSTDWGPVASLLAALVAFATVAIIYLAFSHYWDRHPIKQGPKATTIAEPKITASSIVNPQRNDIPDLRVADHPRVCALFEDPERDRLIPLLEGDKFSAWVRPMKGDDVLTSLSGKIWKSHFFQFFPKQGDHDRAQTFIKTKARQESVWFDLHFNQRQTEAIWPGLEWMPILVAARIAHETCEEIGIEHLVSSASGGANEALSYHVHAFIVRDFPLKGCRPPSTVLRLIPSAKNAHLRHVAGSNSLTSLYASEPLRYDDVRIVQADLDDYLQSLHNLAKAEL